MNPVFMPDRLRRAALHPFDTTAPGAPATVTAQARRTAAALELRWALRGEPGDWRIPRSAAPHRADGLWRHTCGEAFIARPGQPGYVEFNAAPSGAWAAYAFDAYRSGMRPLALPALPQIDWLLRGDGLDLRATWALPADLAHAPVLKLALTLVVESRYSLLSYWALAHGGTRPDFHAPAGFMIEI